jgi:uncharacterized membrane protein
MNQALDFVVSYWFSLFLLAAALGLAGAALFLWQRRGAWSVPFLLGSAAFAIVGLGGLALPFDWGLWLGGAALAVLFVMLLVVITTGSWSAALGYSFGALWVLALGGVGNAALGEWLKDGGKLVASLEPTQPWWLLLLGLLPVIVLVSYRSLAGMGPVRRWMAIGLRCALVTFLILALAEVRIRHQNENTTVLFIVDRSLSIPEEYDPEASSDTNRVDLRTERVEKFINDAVQLHGPGLKYDQAGLILFGLRPRLELPPSHAPSFNFRFKDAASTIDGNYTDIGAAIKLALASFPEGTGKRIVLISDGNENMGNAEEQAQIAKLNGVQIDVVPLAAGFRNENEVLVERVEAPSRTEQGSRLPIRVLLRSYNPGTVVGTLFLKRIVDGVPVPVEPYPPGTPNPLRVRLAPGLNTFPFQQPLERAEKSYTYQAIFQPEGVVNERGEKIGDLVGDRVQNNSVTTHVVAMGQRRILVIEPAEGEHDLLIRNLTAMANSKYKVMAIPAGRLPENKADLGLFLSNYDCVILANVPAELLGEEQQEMIRSNTHDQGCGLVMIGGPDSFGAGGWQGTPVEKALPVDCDIKSFKVQGKGGLVLIMHASEMADGNRWQKEIAKLAIKKLSPMDEVGIIHYDWGVHKWHIPLQLIGGKRNSLLAQVDRMIPGDMPDFDPPLKMAYDALTEEKRGLATKHVIIISDGDPMVNNRGLLARMKQEKVTVSTVGVATHGAPQDQALMQIASGTGGRFHKVQNPRQLPAIYIKETRIVSQSFVHERQFQPKLAFKSGPTEKLPDQLNPLWGFVRTTPKQSALVEIPILGLPGPDQDFPILAYWHYGLGKAVAFTSDARTLRPTAQRPDGRKGWDREWAGSEMYSKFWEQVVEWALRPTESGRMVMTTEFRDGEVKVTVDARDDNNRPLSSLRLRGGVTLPGAKAEDARKQELRFEQKNVGVYEAKFKAKEAGSYFVDAQATRQVEVPNKDGKGVTIEEGTDSVRAGVTIPYSPEFADMESNTALLEKLRDMTGGKTISEDLLAKAAGKESGASEARESLSKEVFRPGLPQFKSLQPVWYWLVFLTAVTLFFDVAVRRIAVQPAEAMAAAERVWERMRGRASEASDTPQFMDRLQSRKAQVASTLDQLRAARRFEPGERTVSAPAGADEATAVMDRPAAPRLAAQQRMAPDKQEEAADYASRLLKAKKRVWQEREEPNEPK